VSKILTEILRFLTKNALRLVVILALLIFCLWARSQYFELERRKSEIARDQSHLLRLKDEKSQLLLDKVNIEEGLTAEIKAKLHDLRELKSADAVAKAAFDEAKSYREQKGTRVGWWQNSMSKIPMVPNDSKKRIIEYKAAVEIEQNAYKAYMATLHATQVFEQKITSEKAQMLALVNGDIESNTQQSEMLEERRRASQVYVDHDPINKVMIRSRELLPLAVTILLGIIFMPILVRMFFYFIVAPIASRIGPVYLDKQAKTSRDIGFTGSQVSVDYTLRSDQQMMVHHDFLQSSGKTAHCTTKFLLNWRYPLTSLASGMYLLTKIKPNDESKTKVVLSSQNDALGEIAIVKIPKETSVVVHPRSLAGVVTKRGETVRITSKWRLFSLHAWITFQFRYLVFHGACDLIMRGCRGIKCEYIDSDEPRLINQSATLGFTPTTEYANSRCETFIAYWRGADSLFNDQFGGRNGFVIYEEMPDKASQDQISKRGMEGVVDSLLKVFGI